MYEVESLGGRRSRINDEMKREDVAGIAFIRKGLR
jgi:hypothetical protein